MAKTDPKAANAGSQNGPLDKLPEPEPLPPALQKIIDKADKDDNFYDELWEGT
jgi:mitochondrial fission process protein 1